MFSLVFLVSYGLEGRMSCFWEMCDSSWALLSLQESELRQTLIESESPNVFLSAVFIWGVPSALRSTSKRTICRGAESSKVSVADSPFAEGIIAAYIIFGASPPCCWRLCGLWRWRAVTLCPCGDLCPSHVTLWKFSRAIRAIGMQCRHIARCLLRRITGSHTS